MGMDLLGSHGDERFSLSDWCMCLERSIEFGWNPEGTVAPKEHVCEWNGGYHSNDFQLVTDRDARALGEALLRAIATLSAQANLEKRRAQIRIVSMAQLADPVGIERTDRARSAQADVDLFAPGNPRDAELGCLRRLADYALKGGFVIT
jgi:hypothetical protein